MSIKLSIYDKEIVSKITWGTNNFDEIIAVLKMYHCKYDPDNKVWQIPAAKLTAVIEDLENFAIIEYDADFNANLNDLLGGNEGIKIEHFDFAKADLKVPIIKGKTPYEEYQWEDIANGLLRNRYGLFLEQGLGKSYILSSIINILYKYDRNHKALIVTSPSGVYNFVKELLAFTDYTEKDIAIGGVKNRRPFDGDAKIIVCNYRSLLLISDEYYFQPLTTDKKKKREVGEKLNYHKTRIPLEKWLNGDKGLMILDESHLMSNPKARQTKVIHQLKDYFYYRYISTGTPADKEEKYYSQLSFLDESLVKGLSYTEWLEYHCELGNRFSAYAITGYKPKPIMELRDIVAKNSIRRFANETIELPEHLIKRVYVPFSDNQEYIYQQIVEHSIRNMRDSNFAIQANAFTFNTNFMNWLSAIDYPKLLIPKLEAEVDDTDDVLKAVRVFDFAKDHSKIEVLQDLIEKHDREKIIIWTSHPNVGFDLAALLAKKNPLVINGESDKPSGMSLDEYKAKIVHEFQTNPDRQILIAGMQVLNTAVTIVSAHVQIVFDTNYNYTQYEQALKRIHRIGQKSTVYTYILLIDDSADVTRYQNIINKDFIDKKFLTQQYLSFRDIKEMATMKGSIVEKPIDAIEAEEVPYRTIAKKPVMANSLSPNAIGDIW